MTVQPYRTDGSWLQLVDVLDQLSLPADQPADSPQWRRADRARKAAARWVEDRRPELVTVVITAEDTTVTFDASPSLIEGACLYAARLYARQGSPTGLASYGEFGPAAVGRVDPDIERLCGIGRYARPVAR